MKEYTRVKAVLFSLQNEKLALVNQVNEEQNKLKVLLGNKQTTFIKPILNESNNKFFQIPSELKQLIDTAYANRADAKISEATIRLSQADLKYQRSVGLPDANIGYVYDRQGSFIRDYSAVSLGIDLPVFNRNQGNITISKAKLEQSKKQNDLYALQLENDVQQVWYKTIMTDSLYRSFDKDFQPDFEKVMVGMIDNYQKRNISLIEFLDYYDSYKQNIIQLNELNTQRFNTVEELNYTVGKALIK
jgi:cobalt-zinc-cadmium efflux system outer membrane protein